MWLFSLFVIRNTGEAGSSIRISIRLEREFCASRIQTDHRRDAEARRDHAENKQRRQRLTVEPSRTTRSTGTKDSFELRLAAKRYTLRVARCGLSLRSESGCWAELRWG